MITRRTSWQTYESWRRYGLDNGYNERNSTSLNNSLEKDETSWYNKGRRKKWTKKFRFNNKLKRARISIKTFKEWKEYGLENGFNKRNVRGLAISEYKNERYWYKKGQKEGWLKNFNFKRKINKADISFDNFEDWNNYGIIHNYNRRAPAGLGESKKIIERSWYSKGAREDWLKDFEFKRKIKLSVWGSLEYTLNEAKKFLEDNNFEELPSAIKLKDMDHSDLVNAISRYHGGFLAFREKLREYMNLPSENSQLESLLDNYVNGENQNDN